MKKTTKGALAAGSAAVLLMGGVGTLAFWTDDGEVDLGAVNSGSLSISDGDCGDWLLDAGEPDTAFDPISGRIVPGDTLTQVCAFDIGAVGNHLRAEVGLDGGEDVVITGGNPDATGADVTAAATFAVGPTAPGTAIVDGGFITEANDGDQLFATIVVSFPYGANDTDAAENGNQTQNLTATLDTIAVTLTQQHN